MSIDNNMCVVLEDGQELLLEPTCYCVFIDETGTESLTDKKYPIYGLGGCGILVENYKEWLELPWERMKEYYFGDRALQLHATDIRSDDENFKNKLTGLNQFFGNGPYSRFAAVYSTETDIEEDLVELHELALTLCRDQIFKVASRWNPSRLVIIFESCERTNNTVATFFSNIRTARVTHPGGESRDINVETYFSRKNGLAGLEVADFVIHTAGTTSRDVVNKGIKPKDRPDFEVTFGDRHDEALRDYMFVTKAKRPTPDSPEVSK